jgi:hypothetical protein
LNQRAIYLTVGLMAIALLGTAIIQWYWINWSVQLKEEQFEIELDRPWCRDQFLIGP